MINLVIVVLLWAVIFGGSNYLKVKKGYSYIGNYFIFTGGFVLSSLFILSTFSNEIFSATQIQIIISLSVLAALLLIKVFSRSFLVKTHDLSRLVGDTMSKFSEVFTQQLLIYLMLVYSNQSLLLFCICFLALRLPLFFFLRTKDAVILCVSALFGGLVFASVYMNLSFPFVVALVVHLIFYILLDVLYVYKRWKPILL